MEYESPVVGPDFSPTASPRPRRVPADAPADQLGGALDGPGPVAVGRGVAGDEGLAGLGEVLEPKRERIDAEHPGRFVDVRFDGPDLLRVAEAAEGGRWGGVREDAPPHDPDRRDAIRPVRGVAALGDRAVGDVGVGADEVVGLDVAEQQAAIRLEAGPDADLRRATTDGLEGLLEGQDQADGPARLEGHEGDERLVLGVLLAAEAAAGVGREDAHLGQRQVEQLGDDALQPVRVLDRAPDGDAIAIGGGDETVRLDGELGDHREDVRAFDDDVAPRPHRRRPSRSGAAQDVRGCQRVAGSERRVLHERCG